MIITNAYVATTVEKPTIRAINIHVRHQLHCSEKRREKSFVLPNEDAAMQSTETSEWEFYYADVTLKRCMQTGRSPVSPKSELEAIGLSFHTSRLQNFSLSHTFS